MEKFQFLAHYGNEVKTVEIAQPHQSGNSYQVTIDKWYHGMITKRNGEWVAFWNAKSELGADEISIIGEIIEKNMNQ